MGKVPVPVPPPCSPADAMRFGHIRVEVTPSGGRSFTWAHPQGEGFRTVAGVCLVALVGAWLGIGWVLVGGGGIPDTQGRVAEVGAMGFLAVTLVGVGYVLATYSLPSRPERVTLEG